MAGNSLARRAMRLLGALDRHGAVPVTDGGAGTCVLHLTDIRAVRCPAAQFEAMVRKGWLDLSACRSTGRTLASVSNDGLTWRKRTMAGGDFAGQHRQVTSTAIDGQSGLIRNNAESPLARLARPGGSRGGAWLEQSHLLAGERLRSDFEFGQLAASVSVSWDPARTVRDGGGAKGRQDLSDRALDARARFNRALDAVGPELAGLLADVCCFLKGLEQVELERKWPRRSAKVVLRTALEALDRHYNPPPPDAPRRMRHWGGSDYRPPM